MTGGKAALWDDETMADTLAQKATRFIKNHKKDPFSFILGCMIFMYPVCLIHDLWGNRVWALGATAFFRPIFAWAKF